MSEAVARLAESAAVTACWQQWCTLAEEGTPVDDRHTRSIIDPEALVLASLWLRPVERRISDRLRWWASKGAGLMSVQRLRTMARLFPSDVIDHGVPWFATLAARAGDPRWKRLSAGWNADSDGSRAGKGPKSLHLVEPSTLMLRMRAGFGVGAKADVMSFLLGVSSVHGLQETWTTTNVIAEALSCSRASVRRAAREMTLARFIEQSADRPPVYTVNAIGWAEALHILSSYDLKTADEQRHVHGVPHWRFWGHTFAFLIASIEWGDASSMQSVAPVVRASQSRDIVERFPRALTWTGIDRPEARRYSVEQFLAPFEELVRRLAADVSIDSAPRANNAIDH